MKIFIGADHAGFELKQKLIPFIEGLGHEVVDKGAYEMDPADDYPDFMFPVAVAVSREPEDRRGIVIGGSGHGEAMVVNRIEGARAATYYGPVSRKQTDASGEDLGIIESSRSHNDANVLSIAGRFVKEDEAKDAVKLFLETPFSGDERHVRRIKKIDEVK